MNVYITTYIPSDSISVLINKAEQAYIKILEDDKELLISNMIDIYLYLEKTNKYWMDFNLRNMVFFDKKIIAIDLKYLVDKKNSDKLSFSTEDFLNFGTKVNEKLLLNNILILKFGYYHFEHLKSSYWKKLMALRILIMGINSSIIKRNLFNIFEIKIPHNESAIFQIINLAINMKKSKLEKIFTKIISKGILTKNLVQNRGVWTIKIKGKFHTGLRFGGLGYLICIHLKTKDNIWLKKIKENSDYFSIRNNTIEHGLGGYVLGEIYLLFNEPKMVNKKRLIQRIALLQVLDWKIYSLLKDLLKQLNHI